MCAHFGTAGAAPPPLRVYFVLEITCEGEEHPDNCHDNDYPKYCTPIHNDISAYDIGGLLVNISGIVDENDGRADIEAIALNKYLPIWVYERLLLALRLPVGLLLLDSSHNACEVPSLLHKFLESSHIRISIWIAIEPQASIEKILKGPIQ